MPNNPDLPKSMPIGALQTWPVALLLTLTAGYVDIVGYLSVYQVFTAHMSGNTADMAKHIYALQWSGIVRHAWPILAFVAGLIFAATLFEAQKRKLAFRRLPTTVVLEAVLLLVFLLVTIAIGYTVPPQPAPDYYLMVALLALAMGVQNVTIRKVGGLHLYTTFITGTLVLFAESASQYVFWFIAQWRRAPGCRHLGPILRASFGVTMVRHMALTAGLWSCYLAGATAGAFANDKYQTRCVLAPLMVLIAIAIYGAVRPFAEVIAEEF